ncbi:MAG: putative signal transducing protein [Thermoanaerobaculia bacterium]
MADSNQGFPDDVNTVPAEDGATWVEITSTGSEDEAKLVQGFLEAEGIPAQVENVKFSMEPVNFGMMGEIRVYVGAEDEQRAQALLRSREQQAESLDDDEETLVTDEGPAVIDESAQAERDDGTQS